MNVVVNSQHLAAELRLLNKIVPSKPVIPILSHVLFTADEELTLYATDLECGLSTQCQARIDQPGSLALPIAKLLAMVEQFSDADVTISLEHKQVMIRCGTFKSRLQSQAVQDFPIQHAIEGETYTLDAMSFNGLINKVRHATSAVAKQHILQGALLKLTESGAAMVATDGTRMVLATTAYAGPELQVVIPTKTMDLLDGHLGAGTVEATIGPRHLFFSLNNRLLTSRTLEGKYPAYERMVPRDNANKVQFERVMLTAALRRVILAAEENSAVYFNFTEGNLELYSASVGVGSADETLPVHYEGPPLKVCMNGKYVLDFLEIATGQTVVLLLKDAMTAALFQDGTNCLSVIMLMRGTS